MEMIVSPILNKETEKKVCVMFKDGTSYAEGSVPDCKITKSEGFTPEEISQLETYIKENEAQIRETASKINPIRAMMKD